MSAELDILAEQFNLEPNDRTFLVYLHALHNLRIKYPISVYTYLFNRWDQLYKEVDQIGKDDYRGDRHQLLNPSYHQKLKEILKFSLQLAELSPIQCRNHVCAVFKCRCLLFSFSQPQNCSCTHQCSFLSITDEEGIFGLELEESLGPPLLTLACRGQHWINHPAGGYNSQKKLEIGFPNLFRAWRTESVSTRTGYYYWDGLQVEDSNPIMYSTVSNVLDFILEHSNCRYGYHYDPEDEEWQNILEEGGLPWRRHQRPH